MDKLIAWLDILSEINFVILIIIIFFSGLMFSKFIDLLILLMGKK